MLPQFDPMLWGQGGCIRSGRTDAEGVRLPPLLESGVCHADGQRRSPGAGKPGQTEQPGQVTRTGPRQSRLVRNGQVKITRGPPEQRERPSLSAVVPDAGSDDSGRPGDAAHFAKARYRILHEVDYQLSERQVEGVVRVWQKFGGGQPGVHTRESFADSGDKGLRRINCGYRASAKAAYKFSCERPWPAANVERAVGWPRIRQVGELHRQRRGVAAHEPPIGTGADIKAHELTLKEARDVSVESR